MRRVLDHELELRVRRLALAEPIGAAEIRRRLAAGSDGEDPVRVGYEPIRKTVARIRATPRADRSPAGMADRILSLLDRELAALERNQGKVDLDRLDRIAATLRRVEPIRPKAEEKRASSLRQLLPEGDRQAAIGAERSSEHESERIEDPKTSDVLSAQLR